MLLLNDPYLFKNTIEIVSRNLHISQSYIEKDYYAISILKELVSRDSKFVFKGGTSLSVCQKAINRFSEDIDISYQDEAITTEQRKRIKQVFFEAIEAVSLSVSNPDNIRSRRVFNRYVCPYKSAFNDIDDQVIVEWAVITPSFPIEEKEAQTIIGKYLTDIGQTELVKKYGLDSFTVKTLTKTRTLVDKIFAICDYHLTGKLDRQSRHIYDIHQLLSLIKLNDEFLDVFKRVKDYRINLETCPSAKEGMVISDLLGELIEKNTFRGDYNTKTFPLLYDHIPYEKCIPSIKTISTFLKEHNL